MPTWNAAEARNSYGPVIDAAIAYINDHLGEVIHLEQLARAASLSPYHFHRIFTARVGETPGDFLNRVRLERAANYLIKDRAAPVTQIAAGLGFSSAAVFSRAFKSYFGLPAGQFRVLQGEAYRRLVEDRRRRPEAAYLEPLDELNQHVRLQQMPAFRVAYVPNLAGYDLPKICAAWTRLYRWAERSGYLGPDTLMIGVSYDDPFITPQDRCRYYACMTVPEGVRHDDRLSLMTLPAGPYAVYRCTCRAEDIQLAFHTLYGLWLPGSGYQPADSQTYEIYRETPETNPQGLFVLDICLPVQQG